jgi:hypothetical protein
LIKEYLELKPYIMDRLEKSDGADYRKPIIKIEVGNASDYNKEYLNEYLRELREKYWEILLNNQKFIGKFTSNIQNELRSKLEKLKDYDFNLFNIGELERDLKDKISLGIEDAIIKMFDEFTRFHREEFSKNIHYYNGWKTNSSYKINKKIILPINGFSSCSWKKGIDEYYISERMKDMVKVFNYFEGDLENSADKIYNAIADANKREKTSDIDFHYFTATFYKKGTCHITFKSDDLLEKFNIFGSQKKGWLPPSYGVKRYEEMDEEEKEVIDNFQGKERYNFILENKNQFIINTKKLLN